MEKVSIYTTISWAFNSKSPPTAKCVSYVFYFQRLGSQKRKADENVKAEAPLKQIKLLFVTIAVKE